MKCVISTSGSGAGVWGSENVVRTPGARARVWVGTSGESRGTEAGPGGGRLGATVLGLGSLCAPQLALQSSAGEGDLKAEHGWRSYPPSPDPLWLREGGIKNTSMGSN